MASWQGSPPRMGSDYFRPDKRRELAKYRIRLPTLPFDDPEVETLALGFLSGRRVGRRPSGASGLARSTRM
jgi:hypothetical protein